MATQHQVILLIMSTLFYGVFCQTIGNRNTARFPYNQSLNGNWDQPNFDLFLWTGVLWYVFTKFRNRDIDNGDLKVYM